VKTETKTVEDGNGNKTIRWFAKTDDGFDGLAQGWGYKSKQKLMKAYWYHQNKHKINHLKITTKTFLKDNPSIKKMLSGYFSVDNIFRSLKEGDSLSMKTFVDDLRREGGNDEIITILNRNKHLWNTIEKEI